MTISKEEKSKIINELFNNRIGLYSQRYMTL